MSANAYREALQHSALRRAYADWIKRFILFHDKRHPIDMAAPRVEAFLTDLAVARKVSATTQNQAKSATVQAGRSDCAQMVTG
ncbi:MAG: phage integrase N-terminal SAM-like domain-containing protein [Pyrinomonadaceae bacterium]